VVNSVGYVGQVVVADDPLGNELCFRETAFVTPQYFDASLARLTLSSEDSSFS